MRRLVLFAVTIMVALILSACASVGYTNIDNAALKDMLTSSKDYQFVDVRTSSEYYDEHIPGFTINIDYYKLADDSSLLDRLDKTIPVVIMCNSGNRSASAAAIFVKEGFSEVYNLTNGIQGWDGETE